jgi:hypothetical protein
MRRDGPLRPSTAVGWNEQKEASRQLTFRERQVGDMAEKVREANELITKALRTMIPPPGARARRSSRNGRPPTITSAATADNE